jgi:hypothetical protein
MIALIMAILLALSVQAPDNAIYGQYIDAGVPGVLLVRDTPIHTVMLVCQVEWCDQSLWHDGDMLWVDADGYQALTVTQCDYEDSC